MKVFIIGITGGVGAQLVRALRARGDTVSGLVRRPEQQQELREAGVEAALGDITAVTPEELAQLIGDADAIAFTAGAGGVGPGGTSAVDGEGVVKAIAAAHLNGVERFGLVSVFPEAWRERHLGEAFDHYIAVKKEADIALTRSGLDWIILRPAVLLDEAGRGTVSLGAAETHGDITRQDVAETLAALLHEPRITQQILELNHGHSPIAEAVQANIRTR